MNSKKNITIFLLIAAVLAFFAASCNKVERDENAKLSFSTEELTFDTVFTTVGSVTQNFRVYNPYNFDIKVDIELAGGLHSPYSINVDGVSGTSFKDVEIPANDSVFVFVKVNVNPNDQSTPFLITDSVIFRHGTAIQDVDLVAFGQNAHFIVADEGSGSLRYKIVAHEHETVHWTNDLPYVVYGGYAAVDSLGTLIIDPGTTIYFHTGAGIWVYRYGNIQAVGTTEQPITFRGDNLNSWFETDYGQWDRIWINEGTIDNRFENVEIANAFIGLQVESLQEMLPGRTVVKNSVIHNTYNCGVLARAANLQAENCEVSNNGDCSMLLQIGNYDLKHVTVANYFSQSVRKNPAVYVSNSYTNGYYNYVGNTVANFTNCLIYGSLENEIGIYEDDDAELQCLFDHCLVKCPTAMTNFVDCIRNQAPKFVSSTDQNFTLTEASPAINAGKTGLGILTDLTGYLRDERPDIGAYEYGSRRYFRSH